RHCRTGTGSAMSVRWCPEATWTSRCSQRSCAAKTFDEGEPVTQPTDREHGLSKALTRGQVVMIGLGGAIGTGLFMGSGIAIGYAGPAVILSYAIAGFLTPGMG